MLIAAISVLQATYFGLTISEYVRSRQAAIPDSPDFSDSSAEKDVVSTIVLAIAGLFTFFIFGTTAPCLKEYKRWLTPLMCWRWRWQNCQGRRQSVTSIKTNATTKLNKTEGTDIFNPGSSWGSIWDSTDNDWKRQGTEYSVTVKSIHEKSPPSFLPLRTMSTLSPKPESHGQEIQVLEEQGIMVSHTFTTDQGQ